jgi:hypothetical protein
MFGWGSLDKKCFIVDIIFSPYNLFAKSIKNCAGGFISFKRDFCLQLYGLLL